MSEQVKNLEPKQAKQETRLEQRQESSKQEPARQRFEWRVILRHSPLIRWKSATVTAADEASAWGEYLKVVEKNLLATEDTDKGKKELSKFHEWLRMHPGNPYPEEAEIIPEAKAKENLRASRLQDQLKAAEERERARQMLMPQPVG